MPFAAILRRSPFSGYRFVVGAVKTWSVTLLEAWQIYYLGPTSIRVNYEILPPWRVSCRRQRTLAGTKLCLLWRFHEVACLSFVIKYVAVFYLRYRLSNLPGKFLRNTFLAVFPSHIFYLVRRNNRRNGLKGKNWTLC